MQQHKAAEAIKDAERKLESSEKSVRDLLQVSCICWRYRACLQGHQHQDHVLNDAAAPLMKICNYACLSIGHQQPGNPHARTHSQ